MNNQTDYTILDHMVTVGQMRDPIEALTDRIKWLRSAGRVYFMMQVPFYKSFRREFGDTITFGMEEDRDRMHRELESKVYTAPLHYMKVYTPTEIYKMTGVPVPYPEIWGSKLLKYKELTGKEWED